MYYSDNTCCKLDYGEYPFSDEQESRIYTREQKLRAIEEYLSGTKSGRQIALELGNPNPDVVRDWRHIYEVEKPLRI